MKLSRSWRSINKDEGGASPLLSRTGQSLRKIHLKTAAAGIAQILLLYAGVILAVLFLYPIINIITGSGVSFILIPVFTGGALVLTAAVSIILNPRLTAVYSNRISSKSRNSILAAFELMDKPELNNVEKEFLQSFIDEFSLKAEYWSSRLLQMLIRIIYTILIINLLEIWLMPVWVSNAYGITRKEAVITVVNNKPELLSWNAGNVSGRLLAVQEGDTSVYEQGRQYREGIIFFKGPDVFSNSVPVYMLNINIADSIVVDVQPAVYQRRNKEHLYTKVLTVPEYSAVKAYLYTPYGQIQIVNMKSIREDTVINFRMLTYRDSIMLKIDSDDSPVIRTVISDDDRLKSSLMLPFILLDDYGLDYAGAYIGYGDRIDTIMTDKPDSVLLLEINTDILNNEIIEITGFVKDNNPYRKQISYTEPYRIKLNETFEIIKSVSDSVSSIEDFAQMTEEMRGRLENIKSAMNSNPEQAFEDLKKQAKEMERITGDIKENVSKLAEYKLSDEITSQLMEIKKKAESIESEVLKEVFKDMYSKDQSSITAEEMKHMIMENSEKILKSLDQLGKMLDALKEITELSTLKEMMNRAYEMEKEALESGNEYKEIQKDITEKMSEMAEMTDEKQSLFEYSENVKDMEELSKSAENDKEKGEQLKKEMEKMMSRLSKQMQSSSSTSYNVNEMILNLHMIAEILAQGNIELAGKYYKEIMVYIANEGMPGPLDVMLSTAFKLCSMKDPDIMEIKNNNFRMISYLLNSAQQSGSSSSMSLEQMMNSMKSMSEQEMAISNALWDMFKQGQTGQGMTDEMAKMQREMAEELRRMAGETGEDMMGDMEALADSLDDLADKIEQGNINKQVIETEKRILNRMLTMQKSLYKQGLTDKRESKPGEEYSSGPRIILPDELGDKKYMLRQRLDEYLKIYKNDEFNEIIRKYYMELLK